MIYVMKGLQLAASTVVWLLLNALNQAEMRANTLENENQLLWDYSEKLEQELGISTGKKITLPLPIGQVCNISIDNNQVPEPMELVDQENKNSKSDLDVLLPTDPLEICPIITQKKKKTQK